MKCEHDNTTLVSTEYNYVTFCMDCNEQWDESQAVAIDERGDDSGLHEGLNKDEEGWDSK